MLINGGRPVNAKKIGLSFSQNSYGMTSSISNAGALVMHRIYGTCKYYRIKKICLDQILRNMKLVILE